MQNDMLSLQQLLHSPLQRVDQEITSHRTSNSTYRSRPNGVVEWEGFNESVAQAITDAVRHDPREFYDLPRLARPPRLTDELSVQGQTRESIARSIEDIFVNTPIDAKLTERGSCAAPVFIGIPDLVGWRVRRSTGTVQLLLPLEVKKPHVADSNLRINYLQDPDGHEREQRIVQQEVGYMERNMLQYGIISTYVHTFACKLDRNGALHMSQAISYDDTHPSALAAVWYVMLKATQDPTYKGPRLKSTHRQRPSTKRRRLRNISPASNFSGIDLHAVLPTESLASRHEHTVLRGVAECQQVVVKWGPRDDQCVQRETAMYIKLSRIQGIVIPKLLGWGSTVSRTYMVLQYYPSVTLAACKKTPTTWSLVRTCVNTLHAQGVVHGDLEPRNVLVLKDRAMLVDLESTYVSTDVSVQREEMARLRLLYWTET